MKKRKKKRKHKNSSNYLFRTRRTVKKSVKRLTKWGIGLALLPTVWAALKITSFIFPALALEGYQSWWIYAAGVLSYLAFERFIHKPMWFYVVGHELTHAMSGLLSGARIHSLKAGSTGGEVRLSKSNAFIALSPYIVPFYTLIVIALYAILAHWWTSPHLSNGFQFFVGVSLGFHWSLTWDALHKGQTDLKVLGFFLSGVLIILGNTLIVGFLVIGLFTATPTLKEYGKKISTETLQIWEGGYALARQHWSWLPNYEKE